MSIENMYIIWDTREQKPVFCGNSKKTCWTKKGPAKNALMSHIGGWEGHARWLTREEIVDLSKAEEFAPYRLKIDSFANQTRFECWEVEFVRKHKV